MLEDDIQYGHEMYINTNGNGGTGSFFDLNEESYDSERLLSNLYDNYYEYCKFTTKSWVT